MASVNKAIIVGHLGQDPDIRYMANGDAACNLSIATTESWKDKNTGEKKESTEWHRVSFFGKLAEVCGQYLKKGAAIYVEGSIHTRKWQDKEGQDRYTTEIRGERMQMLGGRSESAPKDKEQRSAAQQDETPRNPAGSFNDFEDDIPF